MREGCAQRATGYGRKDLDPFLCRPCSSAARLQHVLLALCASGFIFALASSKTNETRLISKMFLSFLTVSGRCMAAQAYSPCYKRLKTLASGLAKVVFSVEACTQAEPGADRLLA
mmetsp:Transcript_70075/g.130991  ORF Transcript_70075/g.130991 Transcript_70075/m.130991 type:complete len:115 (+) Transcript_70075:442-786(+)